MKSLNSAGILGAGLGSRLQSEAACKPLALIGDESLLSRLIQLLKRQGVSQIHCALRAELLDNEARKSLPPGCDYEFVNTDTSLHTLAAVVRTFRPLPDHLFLTMADTVLTARDFQAFFQFCEGLKEGECAILATPHIDDEKPLYVTVDEQTQNAVVFGAEPTPFVTSGMYCLSKTALNLLPEQIAAGMGKMRNYLAFLATEKIPIKTFVVEKTVDVDHPHDLKHAREFLRDS
jgi:NDP-sugar pyrophosphorylase family protein